MNGARMPSDGALREGADRPAGRMADPQVRDPASHPEEDYNLERTNHQRPADFAGDRTSRLGSRYVPSSSWEIRIPVFHRFFSGHLPEVS